VSIRPSTLPDWDTGAVNSVPPTVGHKASGYTTDEVPTSAELNGQLNLQGLWIKHLADGDVSLHDVNLTGSISETGAITPPALIDGNTDDYAPTGFVDTAIIMQAIDPTSGSILKGLAGGADGRKVTIFNLDTSAYFTLANQASSSTAANRFLLPSAADLVVAPSSAVTLRYDGSVSRWRLVDFRQGPRFKMIAISYLGGVCIPGFSLTGNSGAYWETTSSATVVNFPLPNCRTRQQGQRCLSNDRFVFDSSDGCRCCNYHCFRHH